MKRALVSVSDKTGLIEFLKPLVQNGLQIISTGGTLKYLLENNISATEVSVTTGFPEVLDGRVKTLHPHIHMGLLADMTKSSHSEQMQKHKVEAFDLVVGNLYPFEKVSIQSQASEEELIEKIDIGGPSFLRSSAKNFKSITVVCDPNDYQWVLSKILDRTLGLKDRQNLAMKVFSLTSYYDALIVERLASENFETPYLNLPLKIKQKLRYGENSHQQATWYSNPLASVNLSDATIHQGKELSYNNILDIDAAVGLVQMFQKPSCVAVKHNNPCGAASANAVSESLAKVIESDPKSIFGGILAFNRPVDLDCCTLINPLFLECIIAPSYSAEALENLKTRKNLRLLSWPAIANFKIAGNYKSVTGGMLQQDADLFTQNNWNSLNAVVPPELHEDMIFGEKVCGYLKSNAIALVFQGQTVGLGMGQVNRIDAVQQAFLRFSEFKKRKSIDLQKVILVSDAFFPFADSIELIAQQGIKWIVQPGGSVKDNEVIAAAKMNNINMTLTSQRHFRH